MVLFADDMITSIKNISIKIPLELVNKFRKVIGYKINTQKVMHFLCSNSAHLEIEIKNDIL